ncbi:hypothetical protein [Actinocrispum wychmicini]|uniref:Uncharacterized protein n=1 Tax=Actinocrispum wychmicini TaxID=1213861 RepID=A0A4R2K563_9PSEU|nr:hypothetical protein [Actinocrispum wychmicini]TCO64959.1 hypothetical protein EV192_101743 [Actinocrispum wychmicini]
MDIPPGSVVITPTELYAEVKGIGTAVAEIKGDVQELRKALPDHESRIRALERRMWWATGVAATFAAGITELVQLLGKG